MSNLKLHLPEKNRVPRSKRIAKEIYRVVSEIFGNKLLPIIHDDFGEIVSFPKNSIITITDADISSDLQNCRIYYRTMSFNEISNIKNENLENGNEIKNLTKPSEKKRNEENEREKSIKKYLGYSQKVVRKMIASQLRLRVVPMIMFKEDGTPELLNQIETFWKDYDKKRKETL